MSKEPVRRARERLFTAVLSDVLDAAGRRSQAMRRGEKLADVFARHGIL